MIGPFSVFRDDELLISLGTLEVVRAHPLRKGRSFALEYPGDVDGRSFKPAFHFRADHQAAVLTIGSETYALSCEWPDAQ